MATSSKQQANRLAVALNIIAAICSLAMGIPWLIRQTRSNSHVTEPSRQQFHQILLKLKNSGYSSLSVDEKTLLSTYTSKQGHN